MMKNRCVRRNIQWSSSRYEFPNKMITSLHNRFRFTNVLRTLFLWVQLRPSKGNVHFQSNLSPLLSDVREQLLPSCFSLSYQCTPQCRITNVSFIHKTIIGKLKVKKCILKWICTRISIVYFERQPSEMNVDSIKFIRWNVCFRLYLNKSLSVSLWRGTINSSKSIRATYWNLQ